MHVEKPLFWHQGLFLQPQHLQLMDKRLASQARPFLEFGKPHFWGVSNLEIQEAGLTNQSFEVLSGSFMFPDGSFCTFPGNTIMKPRSFDDSWLEAEGKFSVYLGLRKWDQAGPNVTVVDSLEDVKEINTRFATQADPEEIQDLHGGGPSAQVKQMFYVVRVFWETEQEKLDNYHLIPIAQLERFGEDIRLSEKFIPPTITVASSEWIVKVIKDVRDQITSRCRQLEEYKSPRAIQTHDFDLGFIVFLLALRSLNRYVPVLQQTAETPNLHPWDVYGLMRQLIGELSTFTDELSATGDRLDGTRALPPYDHNNLWQCFSAVQALVSELLDSITVGPGHLIRLQHDGTFFSADLTDQMLEEHNRYWLVLRTQVSAENVTDSVRRVAKLSTRRNLTTLIARAVPGIPLEYYQVPPPGLPRRANSHYFRIDHTSLQWADVVSSQSISLLWDTAPEDLVAEILIIRSTGT